MAESILAPLGDGGLGDGDLAGRRPILAAVARHLVDFWTWRSLVIDRGLESDEAARAAVGMLLATDD